MDKVPNAWIRELYGVTKRAYERIDEYVLRWCGHVGRMENNRIPKSLFVRMAGSHSEDRPRK